MTPQVRLFRFLDDNRSPLIAISLLACSAALGYAMTVHETLMLSAIVAAIVVGCAIRWPGESLVAVIPVAIFGPSFRTGTELLLIGGVGVGWALRWLSRASGIRPPIHALLIAFGLWLGLSHLASQANLESQLSPGRDLLTLLAGVTVCGLAVSLRPPVRLVLLVLVLSTVAASVVALVWPDSPAGARTAALGLNPNYLGALVALGGVAAAATWLADKRNPIWIAAMAISATVVIHTQSRGALIAFIVGLAALVLYTARPRVRIIVALATVGLILTPGLLDAITALLFGSRTATDVSDSNVARTAAALTAIRYAAEHPILGIGYGQFAATAERDPLFATYLNTHNDFLRLAAESGLPALGLFLALCGLALSARGWRSMGTMKAVVLSYLAGLLFANTMSSLAVTAGFWIVLGLLLALALQSTPRDAQSIQSRQARSPVPARAVATP